MLKNMKVKKSLILGYGITIVISVALIIASLMMMNNQRGQYEMLMNEDVEKRYPVELSLGECRRVELARAIINSPSVLVLDELTASLDEDTIWDLFHLIGELNRLGTTVIMATHAKNFVNLMRKRVITLVDGRIFGDVRNGRYGDVM